MLYGNQAPLKLREDLREGTKEKCSSLALSVARLHSAAVFGDTGSMFLDILIFQGMAETWIVI